MSLLLLITSLSHHSFAQSAGPEDSALYHAAIDSTIHYFYSHSRSRCFNGKEYIPVPYRFSEGSPYFPADEPGSGTIVYDHVYYDDVHLLYDVLQNNLVFVDESHRIMLLNEKVERFSILDHPFVNIAPQDPTKGGLPNGFFQVLYEGNCMMLKKDEKKVRELNSYSGQDMSRVIDTRTFYYLRKGDDFFKIEGKRSFFKLWTNQQKEIKDFIKHNNIKFKRDLDSDYAKVAAFCDQLSPAK